VHPFTDAAGLDIEDRGVEWIVEQQCEKLLPLLLDAREHGELRLSMATACSGTDAPVVAMRVAQEALARRGTFFEFDHVMSCEIEPYKQSFIARNNPGVLLFNDIAECGATPRDYPRLPEITRDCPRSGAAPRREERARPRRTAAWRPCRPPR